MAKYWQKREEELCAQWKTSSEAQKYRIYKELLPAMTIMAEAILNRYFLTLPNHYDLLNEAVNQAFLSLDKFDPERNAYSWMGTVIKHCYHEAVRVNKDRQLFTEIQYDYLDDSDEYVEQDVIKRLDELIGKYNRRKKIRGRAVFIEYFKEYWIANQNFNGVFQYIQEKTGYSAGHILFQTRTIFGIVGNRLHICHRFVKNNGRIYAHSKYE